jgi:hypothetical protein
MRSMKVAALLVTLAALVAVGPRSAHADTNWWVFTDRPYFDPVVADPRAALMKVLFPAFSKTFPFAQHPGDFRLIWDISVGKEIPLFGYESSGAKSGQLAPGSYAFGFWFPIGFHLVEDLVKDDSAPPFDTDYRFAPLGLKAQYAFQQGLNEGAYRLGARVFGGHESTHLGDEFTLHARALYPDFRRINVSYQWLDLTLGLERDASATGWPLNWKLQAGTTIVVFSGKDESYYSTELIEPVNGTVVPSHNRTEPYLSFEVEHASRTAGHWQPFASIDVRYRNVYDYAKTDASQSERRQPSGNLLVGFQDEGGNPLRPALYLRGYYGVNPAGQFRSQSDYWLFGFGLLFHA